MTAVALAVIVTGALKMYDFFAAAAFVLRNRSRAVTTTAQSTRIDSDWTPTFAWAEGKRTKWRHEGREGSFRDRLLAFLVDWLFRAPVLALLQAGALLWVAGGASGKIAVDRCQFPGHNNPSPLLLPAAIVCVSVAAMGIFSLLLLMLLAPNGKIEVVAGQYLRRSRRLPRDRRPFGPIIVVPTVTLGLFLSFAALYLCLFDLAPSAFAVTPCRMDAATMIYFSTSIGATVGFGDITATSDVARLIVSLEVVSFVTMLTLFLQSLRLRRDEVDSGQRPPLR